MYQIERVKMPEAPMRYTKWPFAKMKVGESFFIPPGNPDMARVRTAASYWGKRHKQKYSVRKDGDGLRVIRVQ